MQVTDFSRSFLTFRIDTLKKSPATVTHEPPVTLNNARVQLDCVCRIEDRSAGHTHEFVLGSSCKTERVHVTENIWTEPNADFIPAASLKQFRSIKTFDSADRRVPLHPPSLGFQPERHVVNVEEAFDSIRIDIQSTRAEQLLTVDQVIRAVFDGKPIVAQTSFSNQHYRASLEYPVKTMNVGEREHFYQSDTGPVILPDLSVEPEHLLEAMNLAFVAVNCESWAEFLVRGRVPLPDGGTVFHYSLPVRMETINRLYSIQLA